MSQKNYHSCFIVDVQIGEKIVALTDSARSKYYIDVMDKEAFMSFIQWFKNSFMKAVSQNITVFKYEFKKQDEGCVDMYIKKIYGNEPIEV